MRILKSNTSSAAVVVPPPPPNHHDQATAPTGTDQRSPWHSPVPYLFGGLAATLGLIAFALLILVCSYWKISLSGSGHHDDNEEDMETKKQQKCIVYEEQFVVILAGDDKPTCLATPASCTLDSISIISDHESSTSGSNTGDEKQQSNEEEEQIKSDTDQGSHSTGSP